MGAGLEAAHVASELGEQDLGGATAHTWNSHQMLHMWLLPLQQRRNLRIAVGREALDVLDLIEHPSDQEGMRRVEATADRLGQGCALGTQRSFGELRQGFGGQVTCACACD